jgi:aspartate/methionine/tyrosine aminotransferase
VRFANRTNNVAPFQVMELVQRAQALEAQGKPVIHLSIGEPDFTAPPAVLDALHAATSKGLTQYTSALGIAPLRQAISQYYGDRFNVDIAPSRSH